MLKENLYLRLEFSLLKLDATLSDMKNICDKAILQNAKLICVSPCYANEAVKHVKGKIKIASVVGFPLGISTLKTKLEETKELLDNGVSEIMMVINPGMLKDKKFAEVASQIAALTVKCHNKNAKITVIIQSTFLTEEEIIKMCEICAYDEVDYIKASTNVETSSITLANTIIANEIIKNNYNLKIRI